MNPYKEWLGIPDDKLPESGPPDHYELLRLRRFEDDQAKIEGNYRKLNGHVRQYAAGQYMEESQKLLNEIAKAMLCLTDPEAKRDLDESMGREFAEEPDDFGRRPLDRVLVDDEICSRDQVKEAQVFADARGLELRDAVVQMKLATPEEGARSLAKHLNRPFVELAEMLPEDDILDRVDRLTVKRHSFIPLFIDNDQLVVACLDEPDPDLEEELRFRYGCPMRPVLCTPRAIQQAIGQYYAPGMRDEAAAPMEREEDAPAKEEKATKGKKKKGADKGANPSLDDLGLGGKTVPFSSLSDEEKAQRKQVGIVIMLMPFVIANFIDYMIRGSFPPLAGIVVLIPCALWVTQKYWK